MTLLAEAVVALQQTAASLENWQVVAVALLGFLTYSVYRYHVTKINLPSVGIPKGLFGPWKAALASVTQSEYFLQEGYRKYGKHGKSFKIATPARYVIVLSDPKMIKELATTDDRIMSFAATGVERISMAYTFSAEMVKLDYHTALIQKNLTNRLSSILPEIVSELVLSFEENTNIGPEWTSVDNFKVMLNVISRTTNRLFVGLPICRNKDYLDHCVEFATSASRAGAMIDMFPAILKPIVAHFVINRDKAVNKVVAVVGPVFEERRRKLRELGDEWTDKPNDAIQWISEVAPPNSTVEEMCLRILVLNFVAIHTTSFSLLHLMHDLGAAPHHQEPLREEIESVIAEFGGLTKQALTKMKKLDSCLRESQRLNGLALMTVIRKAMVPHTFSDGTFVPKGTWVSAPATGVHQDEDVYENAGEYDGFRFSRIREQPGEEAKHQMVSVSSEYLAFGNGKHACPGRFFAANELKLLMAYIILNYEFKTEVDGQRPQNKYFAHSRVPDTSAKIMYRERKGRKESVANSLIVVEQDRR